MFSQIQNEMIERYNEIINNTCSKIKSINTSTEWELFKKQQINSKKDRFVKETYKPFSLHARVVSTHLFDDFKIENILINSPLGIEVNATVFSPIKKGIYPGILELTGSSRKLNRHYWASAQTYAKAGYVVILCDVIGFVGERNEKNDVFKDGPLGYLVGFSQINAYISDITACLDYLDTRDDVSKNKGYTATGVSLGGSLSIEAAMFDSRITYFIPVCCTMELPDRILPNLYTISWLALSKGNMMDGIDVGERIMLCAPKNCIIMTGAKDEVFTPEITSRMYEKIKRVYQLYNDDCVCDLFIDPEVGHLYSVEMVNEAVHHLNKYFKGIDRKPDFKDSDVIEIDENLMKSYPDSRVNLYSYAKNEAIRLKKERLKLNTKQLKNQAIQLLNMDSIKKVSKQSLGQEKRLWVHTMEKFNIIADDDIVIPAISIKRDDKKRRGLLVVDEKGMWNEIYQNGQTAKKARFLNRTDDVNEPFVMTIDVSTCGENKVKRTFNDIVEWADTERTLAYLGNGINKPLMGFMTRDILTAIKYMREQENVNENDISIIAMGKCAIAALHATLVDGDIKNLELVNMIESYEDYFDKYPNQIKQEMIIPDVLKYYDLCDIIESLKSNTNISII